MRAAKESTNQEQADDSLGQTEIEAAAFAFLAFHIDGADLEQLAQLPVFLNDALAVHQPESMRALNMLGEVLCTAFNDGLVVKDMRFLFLGHSHASVLDADLHIVVS